MGAHFSSTHTVYGWLKFSPVLSQNWEQEQNLRGAAQGPEWVTLSDITSPQGPPRRTEDVLTALTELTQNPVQEEQLLEGLELK